MRLLISITFLLLSLKSFSQNTIYVGTKSYPATETWNFLKKGKTQHYEFNSTLDVTIAKSSKGGYLMLSADGVFFENQSIGGTILIYLENGEVLTLNNRLYKDFADEKTTAIYSIPINIINKLKSYNISEIRYSILTTNYGSTSKSGFTAQNRRNIAREPSTYKGSNYETAKEIRELF